MKAFPEKRKNRTKSKDELFKSRNLRLLLKKEKRSSEIDKIREVRSQDKTYYCTLGACIFMILLLSASALFGGYK